MLRAVFVFYTHGHPIDDRRHRFFVFRIDSFAKRAERERPVHRPRIEIKNIVFFREYFRHRALSASRGSVQRDIHLFSAVYGDSDVFRIQCCCVLLFSDFFPHGVTIYCVFAVFTRLRRSGAERFYPYRKIFTDYSTF